MQLLIKMYNKSINKKIIPKKKKKKIKKKKKKKRLVEVQYWILLKLICRKEDKLLKRFSLPI